MTGGAPQYTTWRNNAHHNWWQDGGLRKLHFWIGVIYLSITTFGFDGSLLNGLQTLPQWNAYFNNPSGNRLGLISASQSLPGIVVPFFAAWTNDRFGRKFILWFGGSLLIAGAIVQATAKGDGQFIASRVLVGSGSALQASAAPILVTELAHPRTRGRTTSLYMTTYYVGSILAAWICFGMLGHSAPWIWRVPCGLQGAFTLIQMSLLAWMPESPRWLVSKGRDDEALQILARYHANGDVNDELVRNELLEIQNALASENQIRTKSSWFDMIRTSGNRRRTTIVVISALGAQLNGVGILSYYLAPVLALVGITNPRQQGALNGGLAIWNWILSILGSMAVDRVGRRPIWLFATLGMMVSYIIVTALSATFDRTSDRNTGLAVIPMIFITFGFYDICWTPLPTAYSAEILSYSIRSMGMSLLQTVQALALAFNQWVNPVALEAIAWRYYIVYIGTLFVLLVLIWFLYPETKGYTIEELAEVFDGEKESHIHDTREREQSSDIEIGNFEKKSDDIEYHENVGNGR
ncbi:Sugar transporter STL1 [Saccharomyces cerevisiae S288c] [Rhizoctonia solani]|uniref:Sugar transporter STL1 [Saccharomyces cerevisiae S288c] n=1 Tax=Rhizoctonia solani TaxID=456999 RepID=A0A0K6G099_9AGAM|nr:Sugar transporter STL1 [Saccharomyces cerevisiae S288c] [Rhizoctonia solani]